MEQREKKRKTRFSAESTHDGSLKMQKRTPTETKLFTKGHARQVSTLTHGMAKFLSVINIYARAYGRQQREKARAMHAVRTLLFAQYILCNNSTFSAERFFDGIYFIFAVCKSCYCCAISKITDLRLSHALIVNYFKTIVCEFS